MRLISFAVAGPTGRVPRLAALIVGDADDGVLIDVNAAATTLLVGEGLEPTAAEHVAAILAPTRLLELVRGGPRAQDLTEQAVDAATTAGWESSPCGARIRYACADLAHGAATAYLPAILDPPLLRDFMAFEQHLINIFPRLGREIPSQWYELPVYYKANPSALGAHGQPIAIPSYADELDLEFELAAIIGRGGIDIAEEEGRRARVRLHRVRRLLRARHPGPGDGGRTRTGQGQGLHRCARPRSGGGDGGRGG